MTCIRELCGLVDFITINVSSPNTPGLRDLQGEAFLDDLLSRCIDARDAADQGRGQTIVLLKIAPDLSLDALDAIVETALRAQDRWADGLEHHDRSSAKPERDGARQGNWRIVGKAAFRALDEAARRNLSAGRNAAYR